MRDIFDKIKGQKIKAITYSEDGQDLTFTMEDESTVKYEAYGECCSSSYIEDIDNPEIFINANLIDVDVVYGESKNVDYEVHEWTFYKFKTDKGMATLSFRNESNGYYGGSLELVD